MRNNGNSAVFMSVRHIYMQFKCVCEINWNRFMVHKLQKMLSRWVLLPILMKCERKYYKSSSLLHAMRHEKQMLLKWKTVVSLWCHTVEWILSFANFMIFFLFSYCKENCITEYRIKCWYLGERKNWQEMEEKSCVKEGDVSGKTEWR